MPQTYKALIQQRKYWRIGWLEEIPAQKPDLHVCSADKSRSNKGPLRPAMAVFEELVTRFLKVFEDHGQGYDWPEFHIPGAVLPNVPNEISGVFWWGRERCSVVSPRHPQFPSVRSGAPSSKPQ